MSKNRSPIVSTTDFWIRIELMILYYLLFAWGLIGLIAFFYLLKEPAPYGKHIKEDSKYFLGSKTGWILMESPAFYLMLLFFLIFGDYKNYVQIVLTFLFCLHLSLIHI